MKWFRRRMQNGPPQQVIPADLIRAKLEIVDLKRALEESERSRRFEQQAKQSLMNRLLKLRGELKRWQDPNHMQLHAGEMTAQEIRSVVAVLRYIQNVALVGEGTSGTGAGEVPGDLDNFERAG